MHLHEVERHGFRQLESGKLPSVSSKLSATTTGGQTIATSNAPTRTSKSTASSKAAAADERLPVLHGKYRSFFLAEYHERVFDWYNNVADTKQRHDFKRFVKTILEFDGKAAAAALPATQHSDVTTGSAIVRSHGGEALTDVAREQAAAYLSFAPKAEQESYRRVFGYILHIPRMYPVTQYRLQYDPHYKFFKGENMLLDQSRKAYAKALLPAPSAPVDHSCEVVGDGKSAYGVSYAWKVAPKTASHVTQKAHESTFQGAPWGKLGELGAVMYETQTAAFFKDTYYDAPQPRRYQNYNDNYTHVLYKQEKMKRHGTVDGATMDKLASRSPFTPTPAVSPVVIAEARRSPSKTSPMGVTVGEPAGTPPARA